MSFKQKEMIVAVEIEGSQPFSVQFDRDDGFEVLSAQIQSISGVERDIVVVDSSGRVLVDDNFSFATFEKEGTVFCVDLEKSLSSCTRSLQGEDVIQPSFRIEGTQFVLCKNCTSKIDASLLSSGLNLEAFSCACEQAAEFGLLYCASDNQNENKRDLEGGDSENSKEFKIARDLYWKRELLQAALQQEGSVNSPHQLLSSQAFRKRLEGGVSTVMVYEQEDQLRAARHAIDYTKIKEKADEYVATLLGAPCASDVVFITGLLRWFKDDFFHWCGKPRCKHLDCQAPPQQMASIGMVPPSPEERNIGWASRTELYRCKECGRETRFARFNNPAHLLTTRRGRCGEWANCFCLVCRALSLDARYVLDFTDHVWVEVFVPSMDRFVHCDPCEKSFDAPLSYEQGWNKALTHILSFSRYGVTDISPRYSRALDKVILRRSSQTGDCVLESAARRAIAEVDIRVENAFIQSQRQGYLRGGCSATGFSRLRGTFASSTLRMLADPARLAVSNPCSSYAAMSALELTVEDMLNRKATDRWEIHGLSFQPKATRQALKAEESQGRSSGDAEWKAQRGEGGVHQDKDKESKNKAIKEDKDAVDDESWLARAGRLAASLPSCRTSYAPYLTQTGSQPWIGTSAGDNRIQLRFLLALCMARGGLLDVVWSPQDQGSCWRCLHTGFDLSALLECCVPPAPSFNLNVCRARLRWPDSCIADMKASSSCVAIAGAWVPSHAPFKVVTASEGEEISAFHTRVEQIVLESIEVIAFVITDSVAALYTPSSLPLQRVDETWFTRKHLTCRVKVLSNALIEQLRQYGVEEESTLYVPLSGSKHGDSVPFDIHPHSVSKSSCQREQLCIVEISVFASHQFVNGLQIRYSDDSVSKTLGCGDPPASKQTLDLRGGDVVTRVSVRAGNIVDSVTISTKNGQELKAGGQGGADAREWQVFEQERGLTSIAGFFGGTGGHLHNLGVVVRKEPSAVSAATILPPAPPSIPLLSPISRLLEGCEADPSLCEWEKVVGGSVHGVISVLQELYANTGLSAEVKGQVIDAAIVYSNNIADDPSNLGKRRVKLSNSYFLSKVAVGGRAALGLFCCGPAAFSLVPPLVDENAGSSSTGEGTDLFLTSKLRLYHEGGTIGKSSMVAGMRSYSRFLQAFKAATQIL